MIELLKLGVPIVLLGMAWGLLWLMRRDQIRRGEERQRNNSLKEALNDVEKAKDIRDRLASDPDYARRVREKYLRD